MNRIMRKALAALTALSAAAAICPAPGFTASAADADYTDLVSWAFDDTDTTYPNSYSDGTLKWTKGGYSATDLSQTLSLENGRLKVVQDYSGASNQYGIYGSTVSYSLSTDGVDLSAAARLTFDYYCPTDGEPNQMQAVFVDAINGTKTINGTDYAFNTIATSTTSDLDGYSKYNVVIALDSISSSISRCKSFQFGERNVPGTSYTTAGLFTRNNTVYYDNVKIQKAAETASSATVTLGAELAVYNTAITASATDATAYQWYTASSYTGEGTAVTGATSASYTPGISDIGGWLYCKATVTDGTATSGRVRVAANSTEKEKTIPIVGSAYSNGVLNIYNSVYAFGKYDPTIAAKGGYFLVNYTTDITTAPKLQYATWATGKTHNMASVDATSTTTETDSSITAKYLYNDIAKAWGDEDFSDLSALRLTFTLSDTQSFTLNSVKYVGPPLSYGDLGTEITLRSSKYLFTRHVGGDGFDATALREDDVLYAECSTLPDSGTLNMIISSHSAKTDGDNVKQTYATISPAESGTTGSGYYAKYNVSDIKSKFGTQFRYIDKINFSVATSLYLFEGTGALVDDISKDGYSDAINVPWTKYDDTAKDGIAVIGASISQNPLVTPLALSGKPYYKAQGGWNVILDRTDVVTYGIGSQTTDDIAARFHEVLDYNYKQIIIQCGNNDLGNFSTGDAAAQHEYDNYVKMMNMVQAKMTEKGTTIPVYIIAINPVGQTATTTNEKIPKVLEKLKTLENKYSFVTYIDKVYGDFLDTSFAGKQYTDFLDTTATGYSTPYVNSSLVMSDGLHPVAAGYAIHAKYLKPLLSKTSTADDATLASLSYRMNASFDTEEAKTVVPGFESGKAGGSCSVTLPSGTTDTASFRLYVSASNIASDDTDTSNATVTVNGATVTGTDEYGNEYAEITLAGGRATANIAVTSADGSKTGTYVVSFKTESAAIPECEVGEIAGSPFADGSRGWTATLTPGNKTITLGSPTWKITNSDSKVATLTAALGGATTISGSGSAVFGLVLTAANIGDNTISNVEFIYGGTE